jgi:chaperonin cofactor prefoldin
MKYNEFEKDLEALEKIPSIKNKKRVSASANNLIVKKDHQKRIETLEKRIETLEKLLKSIIMDVKRIDYSNFRLHKQQTQRDADGNYLK